MHAYIDGRVLPLCRPGSKAAWVGHEAGDSGLSVLQSAWPRVGGVTDSRCSGRSAEKQALQVKDL